MLSSMTCGRARKLMPLYAAGDLAGRRARRVAAHAEGCDSCRRLAAEFAETREWARFAAEPPDFGAEFYEQLRGNVLDEIGRDRRRAAPRRATFFDALQGRRLAYAASFALALFAAALAFNFYSRRAADGPPSPLANSAVDARDTATPAPAPAPDQHDHEPRPTPPRSNTQRRTQPRLELSGGGSPRRVLNLPHRTAREPAGRDLIAGASAAPAPRQVVFAGAAPTKPGEVARIEMQTADPNIRIIWLAPQEPDAPAPKR